MNTCHCSKQRNAFYHIVGVRHNGGGKGFAKAPRSVLRDMY